MRCFLLLEHERKPLLLRGERIVPATVVALTPEALATGNYVGLLDSLFIEVKSLGLLADATPEAKAAYALMRARAVTLDMAASSAQCEQVFVGTDECCVIGKVKGTPSGEHAWPADLIGYWLPAAFRQGSGSISNGWLRAEAGAVECIFVGEQPTENGAVSARPLWASDLVYEFTVSEHLQKWVYSGGAMRNE